MMDDKGFDAGIDDDDFEDDFDFANDLFMHFGKAYHITEGRDLFEIWHQNFMGYQAMDVYTVDCVTD